MQSSCSKQIGGRMWWLLRASVHKANLNRIRNYADSVVQQAGQAVFVGSKLFHSNIDTENLQNFQHIAKRLEELAVSSTGEKRVVMLRSWLNSIREVENALNSLVDADDKNEEGDESMQPALVLYQDTDRGGEPLTFLDVFLRSEALEGIGLSLILEAPNDEESALVLEIFGHCLMGGKEVHQAILSSIQDLAKVFSCYQDEALMRRNELLQFARSSISGLKTNANQARIDVEVTSLKNELMKEIKIPSDEDHGKSSQLVKEALSQVRLYSKLKALLLQKKDEHHGDSPQAHAQKVDKLKILLHSLSNTTSKIEKRIENDRHKKDQVLSYRTSKEHTVFKEEKEMLAEIGKLQQQKDALEAQLEEVKRSIATANDRLQITREERQHLDKANTEIFHNLESKEHQLLRSVVMCKTETEVASAWISFIESTWRLQCNFTKQTQDIVNAELGKFAEHFVNLSMHLLPAYKNELSFSVKNFEEQAEKLQEMSNDHSFFLSNEALSSAKRRRKLEEDYLDMEAKLSSAFSVVESIKQLLAQSETFYRKDNQDVQRLMDDLQKVKDEFESIERPDLRVETPITTRWRKVAKKLAYKDASKEMETPDSKLMPKQQHLQQIETPKSNEKNNKPRKKHHRVLTVGGDEIEVVEDTPKRQHDHVIDGQEILDSDDDMTALESEKVTCISSNKSHELDDWEV